MKKLYNVTFNKGQWVDSRTQLPTIIVAAVNETAALDQAQKDNPKYSTWDCWAEEIELPGVTINVTDNSSRPDTKMIPMSDWNKLMRLRGLMTCGDVDWKHVKQQIDRIESQPNQEVIAIAEVQSIFDKHKKLIGNMKENRARIANGEEGYRLTDAETRAVDEQIQTYASVLSDLNKILHKD